MNLISSTNWTNQIIIKTVIHRRSMWTAESTSIHGHPVD